MFSARHIALTVTLLVALSCGEGASAPPVSPDPAQARESIEVKTAVARRGTVLPRLVAPGSIAARRTSMIGAEVTGRIDRVFVDVGDRVESGDPLFELDRSTYEAAVQQAEAGLELARAERRQLEADLKRSQELRQKQALSQQGLEQIETQLAVGRARERQAAAALVIARQNLAKTRVFAPYAGTVAKRLADEGTTARSMPQTIVLELQETGELEGLTTLPESVHARVHIGDAVLIAVEGLQDPIETRIFSIADTIDPATRTFLVRMQIPNPDRRIKAGGFARVEIFPEAQEETLSLPPDAVRTEAGQTSVLIVRGGEAVEVPVRLGIFSEDAAEVLSGLDEGAVVLVGDAARELAPGTPVRPRGTGEAPRI